jgi:hypothetical protein
MPHPSLLLPDPSDMPLDGFVGQEQLFRVVFFGEILLVGDEVMNPSVTLFAEHEVSLAHLLLPKPVQKALLPMNISRD